MAINIFIGEANLPKDVEFIQDVDAFCTGLRLRDSSFVRKVLCDIEQGKYVSDDIFEDRFGRGLYVSCLSTSSKILISLYQNPNKVINCTELGKNALDYVLLCGSCKAYFMRNDIEFRSEVREFVYVNNIECQDIDDVQSEIRSC